jgi:Uma2 family endonuclease
MLQNAISIPFTIEDYMLFPEDGKRHEIIEGEHVVSPSPLTRHQRILRQLFNAINNFLQQHPLGEVLCAPMDVVLSNLNVVQPDILFIATSNAAIITEKNIQGPPNLVIEILSESTRKTDEVVKRRLYARYGVQEYWVVDPELETVKIYRITGADYLRVSELSCEAHASLTTPLLPHFVIDLTQIFR